MISNSKSSAKDVNIPDVIVVFAKRLSDKTQPQWVKDNNRRTLEDIRKYIDNVLKIA